MRIIDPTGKNPTIDFAGVRIPVVYDEGKPRIIMRLVIEDLGLNPSGQLKDLKDRRAWADLKELYAHARGEQRRLMVTATPATFVLWLNNIVRVPDENQEHLDRYRAAIQNVLSGYAAITFPRSRA